MIERQSGKLDGAYWRKKPVVVRASQWQQHGDHPAVTSLRHPDPLECELCGKWYREHGAIRTMEDTDAMGHLVCPGDWIIKGVQGEFYACKPDIFAATYESAELPECGTNNAAPQELPAVNSASRQDAASSTHPGAVGRSDIGTEKDAVAPVRDSAKYPAVAAPTPRTDLAQFAGIPEMGRGARFVVEADFARQLERDLAAANRSLDWCGQQIAACEKYVKSGETIQQAMERNWQDSQNALGLFAKERLKCERLERESADMTKNWQGACIDLGNLQMQKTKDEESVLGTPVSTSGAARDAAMDEVIAALGEREDSLRVMTDRAGYTREGSDLAQRTSATNDAINIVRALKARSTASATQEHKLPLDYYADPRADE